MPGPTWSAHTSPLDGQSALPVWSSDLSLWVIPGVNAAGDGDTISYSSDGVTWTGVDVFGNGGSGAAVAWSSALGLFAMTGYDFDLNEVVATSPDGINWTVQTTPISGSGGSAGGAICWADALGLFVMGAADASSAGNDIILTSPDGVTWTVQTTPLKTQSQPFALTFGNSLLVCGGSSDVGTAFIMTSPDGVTWTEQVAHPSGGAAYAVIWSPTFGVFLMAGSFDSIEDVLLQSADGVIWTEVPTAFSGSVFALGSGVVEANAIVTVVGKSDNGSSPIHVASSLDLTSWVTSGASFWSGGGFPQGIGYSTDLDQLIIGSYVASGSSNIMSAAAAFDPSPLPVGTIWPPLWRYFIADLDGSGITDFAKLASGRVCEVVLNAPLTLTGVVPSDNPQVYIPYDGDGYNDPYLAEGTRLLWGFRRESSTSPYYTCRAGTLVEFVEDTAEQDDARTRFVGSDPWQLMFSRPVTDIDGTLVADLPNKLISWTATKVSVIICELLRNTILNHGHAFIDAGDGARSGEGSQYQDWGGTGYFLGDLASGPTIDWNIAQGTSVGEAWQQLTAAGYCDIVLKPIYEPSDRPNYLVEMNVYVEAGEVKDEVIFAWNLPSRSLVGLSRQEDGAGRANKIKFFAGQGGSVGTGTLQTDAAAVAKYGEYWSQQFFPGVTGEGAVTAVDALATDQLALRARGKETVTFRPAPERSPRPWIDYDLGDRVQVWASGRGFRRVLGQQDSGTMTETQYQRIYGWTANISDEALETIDPVLTSPQGF